MQCKFTKQSGEQCGAQAIKDSNYCFSHNPETKEAKKEAVIKGGLALKKQIGTPLPPLPLKTNDDIISIVRDTVNRIRTSPMTPQKANSIGYLLSVVIRVKNVVNEETMERIEEKIEKLID